MPTGSLVLSLPGGECVRATGDLHSLGEELGSGSYGCVYNGTRGDLRCAIKRFTMKDTAVAKREAAEVSVFDLLCTGAFCSILGTVVWPVTRKTVGATRACKVDPAMGEDRVLAPRCPARKRL